jgi:hypothetical protein
VPCRRNRLAYSASAVVAPVASKGLDHRRDGGGPACPPPWATPGSTRKEPAPSKPGTGRGLGGHLLLGLGRGGLTGLGPSAQAALHGDLDLAQANPLSPTGEGNASASPSWEQWSKKIRAGAIPMGGCRRGKRWEARRRPAAAPPARPPPGRSRAAAAWDTTSRSPWERMLCLLTEAAEPTCADRLQRRRFSSWCAPPQSVRLPWWPWWFSSVWPALPRVGGRVAHRSAPRCA